MKPSTKTRRAFTLIEVMVVVGIIVLLISILIPAVGAARSSSRKVATTAQMRNIAMACDSYFQTFQAYPGVLPETTYAAGVKFSSSQSLLLTLSRAWYTAAPSGVGAPAVSTVVGTGLLTSDDPSVSPKDYSVGVLAGSPARTYTPFLNPAPAELSSSIGVFAGNVNPSVEIPVFVDHAYGTDALPILYYRAAQRYDKSVVQGGASMATVGTNGAGPLAAFYAISNDYVWTDATNQSSGSKTFNSSGLSNLTSTSATYQSNLQSLLFNAGPNGTFTQKGAYVLISAGPDRYYGADPKGNVDDIVVAGGS